jgi:hypothetical protein
MEVQMVLRLALIGVALTLVTAEQGCIQFASQLYHTITQTLSYIF